MNLGVAYKLQGDIRQAEACFREALQYHPDAAEARFHLGMLLLSEGHYAEGFPLFEARWQVPEFARHIRDFSLPWWRGEALTRKTLYLWADQGVGDMLMFAGLLPEVAELAGQCIVDAPERLLPLFRRSFAALQNVRFVTAWDDMPKADYQLPLSSLAAQLRTDGVFPAHPGYLVADPERVQVCRARYAMLGKEAKIGISWHTTNQRHVQRKRSIALVDWLPLFRCFPEAVFISLQYGDHRAELQAFYEETGFRVHADTTVDALDSLEDFAAQVAAMDQVISIDNSTVHMAGALGVPVQVLLPEVADWRWVRGKATTPWYPTMQLCWQRPGEPWGAVIQRVAELG